MSSYCLKGKELLLNLKVIQPLLYGCVLIVVSDRSIGMCVHTLTVLSCRGRIGSLPSMMRAYASWQPRWRRWHRG